MNHKSPCHDFTDMLVDYSDGELAGDQAQLVREHIAVCSACASQLAQLDASLCKLRLALAPAKAVQNRPGRKSKVAAAAIAVTAASLLILSLWLTKDRSQNPPRQSSVAQSAPSP